MLYFTNFLEAKLPDLCTGRSNLPLPRPHSILPHCKTPAITSGYMFFLDDNCIGLNSSFDCLIVSIGSSLVVVVDLLVLKDLA